MYLCNENKGTGQNHAADLHLCVLHIMQKEIFLMTQLKCGKKNKVLLLFVFYELQPWLVGHTTGKPGSILRHLCTLTPEENKCKQKR